MTAPDAHLEAQYEDANGCNEDCDHPWPACVDREEDHECSFPRDRETNEALPCYCGMDPDTWLEEHSDEED